MSSIVKRPNGKWRARYRDEAGHEHARHFDRKVDGQRWLDEVTASQVTGQYVDPRAGKVLLRDYAARWETTQVGRDRTLSNHDVALRLHILPLLGDIPLTAIRRSDVQGMVRALIAKGLGPGTVRNVHDTARRLLAAAVDDRLIATTPCVRIVLPAATSGEVMPPSLEEVERLADAVPTRYRAAVVLLAGSGLRIGELLGLRTSDVDFLRRELRVERQRLQSGALGPPKTDESHRTIPLARVVVDELAAHLAAYGMGEWLFTTSTGSPATYAAWTSIWEAAQRVPTVDRRRHACPRCSAAVGTRCVTRSGKEANVDHGERDAVARGREATDTHALRHFFASCQISGGSSVKQVSRLLGHASAVVTLRVYAHLWPGDDDRARDVMDSALGRLQRDADSLRTAVDHG